MVQGGIVRSVSQPSGPVRLVPLAGILAPLLLWSVLSTAETASSAVTAVPLVEGVAGRAEVVTVSAVRNEPTKSDSAVVFEISGLRADAGHLCVAVFGRAAGFPNTDRAEQTQRLEVRGDRMTVELRLRAGEPQAVAVFQDIDGNGRLSKNLLGIPVEPYGFSRNARGALGPPKFDSASIVVPAEPDELSIRLK
ncbi:MAG: DUF2141 domain-containing protein [Planctomyces sp.]